MDDMHIIIDLIRLLINTLPFARIESHLFGVDQDVVSVGLYNTGTLEILFKKKETDAVKVKSCFLPH
jgi:hypothetical protein